MLKELNISFISSYIPRQCGIGTFTNDLARSLSELMGTKLGTDKMIQITAINNTTDSYKYSSEVKFEIQEQVRDDYNEAANYLNLSDSEVISLQHEFGIFGGEFGSNIIPLIHNLKKPVVTTLHTILENPLPEQLDIIKEIGRYSSFVVVQSKRGMRMLENIYKIPRDKIVYIPHGAPDVPFLDTSYYKDKLLLTDRKVLLTFGLLGPSKGIEDVINALPRVIKKYPNVTYVVLGATHPEVKRVYGEEYRDMLEKYVTQHSLEDHVMFINRFVEYKELLEFLLLTDIYVSPNHARDQIVSGTLTYALASGKAIISTPFWFAEEILNDETGILVPFKDIHSISSAILDLLNSENKRNRMRKKAYDTGRALVWSNIAQGYHHVFQRALEGYKHISRLPVPSSKFTGFPALPDINLNHLINLTDSVGIFQHAKYFIPDRNEGYCTDDAARALLLSVMHSNMFNNTSVLRLANVYLSFIQHAFNEKRGLFRNFMGFDRSWSEEVGSEDSNSRALFALGYIIKNPPYELYLGICKTLFDQCINNTQNFRSPRAMSRIIMACSFYQSKFSGAREVLKIQRNFTEKLSEMYKSTADTKWKWFEEIASYSNARLPQSLLITGKQLKNKTYISQALESLKWLFDVQYDEDNKVLSLIGNKGWFKKGHQKAKYDQQPVEIPNLIDACYEAFKITKDKEWITRISTIFNWFLGNNDRSEMLYDYLTGGCYDGLSSSQTNKNLGAESTLSWLLSLHKMMRIKEDLRIK
jgi:glycosyltransferase involved in cell wall biosynthesis